LHLSHTTITSAVQNNSSPSEELIIKNLIS
jgi:hypothetical protein